MVFDPLDFLRLADQMIGESNKNPAEACNRTIISRSYYSAFLAAREKMLKNDPSLKSRLIHTSNAHGNLISELDKLSQSPKAGPDILTLKIELDTLRRKRNLADYELAANVDEELARKCVETARDAISLINGGSLSTP
ncbi:hypothetical protein PQ610_02080 [Tardisphaera miroshnichenkoae]